MAERKGNKYPFFVTCALIENKGFYRIKDLDQYLHDGSSVTKEYVGSSSAIYMVCNQNFDLKEFLINI